ncbi:hypothetical protein SJAG_05321 [Schizosaccharomyces japonicus yFS275]|uniref:Transcription factor CBF/NF-Y/archaeal histone domain-containing protein n=1 Tax=Schizosaccharomyces japonicus (strain yFS275 / FY16936) TaxID=402676 RepID=B6K5X6_SCHJY|nr:hypothetical protein SJAG_05321 [Schizosaccharomyces japonicus yFS275]EEB08930.2 hypothetical protein SJAG_05321 [Schizosaccharomyces japonicus yFS275]
MAPIYPKSRLKRLVKQKTNRPIENGALDLMYMDYCIFLQTLLKESNIEAAKEKEKQIQASHIERAENETLAKFRG